MEPAAEPSPPPAVVWEGPKLEQIPRGSFFSFLREYGQWERAAEQPALSCSTTGRTLTFRDLERRVASAAAAFAREGFGRGEHGARGSFLFFSRALSRPCLDANHISIADIYGSLIDVHPARSLHST